MSLRSRLAAAPALVVAGAAFLAPAPAAADREAKMFAITDWDDDVCPGGDRPSWDNMADAWYDEITDHSGWYKAGSYVNGDMNRSRFCDPDTGLAGCNDGAYLDAADAAIIALHGADSGNHWRGTLRRKGGVDDCKIDAPEVAGGGELWAGDLDLEFLHLSSCNSMDDDNLPYTRHMFEDPVDTPRNGRRLHQATGFHGVMWISSGRVDDYEDFADDAFDIPIGLAWEYNLYDTGVQDYYDQCPVAYAVSNSLENCLNRLTTERYDNVYSDPPDNSYWCVYYYDGCDPKGDDPFVLP